MASARDRQLMVREMLRRAYYDVMPEPLQRALLVRRRERVWLNAGILFIHVPKAAGTTINEALYGRFMGHVRATDVERWGSHRLKALPRLAIVRNPWDRLVSAYRFVTRGGGIGPKAGQVRHPEQYRTPEFRSFDSFVADWLARRDPQRLDFVFQPQSLFVCDALGRILVDQLGRFESLNETYSCLRERMPGLPPLSAANRSGETVDYRNFYTPSLADKVGEIYADDVRIFEYRFG